MISFHILPLLEIVLALIYLIEHLCVASEELLRGFWNTSLNSGMQRLTLTLNLGRCCAAKAWRQVSLQLQEQVVSAFSHRYHKQKRGWDTQLDHNSWASACLPPLVNSFWKCLPRHTQQHLDNTLKMVKLTNQIKIQVKTSRPLFGTSESISPKDIDSSPKKNT